MNKINSILAAIPRTMSPQDRLFLDYTTIVLPRKVAGENLSKMDRLVEEEVKKLVPGAGQTIEELSGRVQAKI